ncbi:amiloride-sensitive amine oxidase [copper-containing]-like, partial [Terrapene carolina triunguis]
MGPPKLRLEGPRSPVPMTLIGPRGTSAPAPYPGPSERPSPGGQGWGLPSWPVPPAGTQNSFETLDVRFENISNPWSAGERVVQPRLHRRRCRSERQAAFPFGTALPRYLLFSSPTQRNRWGHPRSYRIQYSSQAGRVLPRGWREERGVAWGRYHLAVTRHHEKEATSSSPYAQHDPWQPAVDFESFIRNDENIENQ